MEGRGWMREPTYRPDGYNTKLLPNGSSFPLKRTAHENLAYTNQEDILPLLLDFARYIMPVEIQMRYDSNGIRAYLEGVLVHDTDCEEGENRFLMVFHRKARICFDSKDVVQIDEPFFLGHMWTVWLAKEW